LIADPTTDIETTKNIVETALNDLSAKAGEAANKAVEEYE
jgi:hypothetical protein